MDSRLLWRRARELQAAGRLLDAIDAYRESLATDDSQADKWNDLGNALANAAMLAEAHGAYREALKRNPAYHQVESNLLINLHYDPAIGADEMFAAHRAWAARHAAGITANPPTRRTIGPSERIRVGFMSPALREGPTAAYLAPLLEHLDPGRIATFLYRTAGSEDAMSARLRRAAGVICYFASSSVKRMFGYDDSLDAFGVHCIGGIVGALLTGVFNVKDISASDGDFMVQLGAVLTTLAVSGIGSFIILKVIDMTIGLRVTEEQEREGLDISLHGEQVQ